LVALVAGQHDLLRVDNDDVVTGVHVRCVRWLVLAAQQVRDLGRQTAEDDPLGVDHMPGARDVAGFGRVRGHGATSSSTGLAGLWMGVRAARSPYPGALHRTTTSQDTRLVHAASQRGGVLPGARVATRPSPAATRARAAGSRAAQRVWPGPTRS